MSSGRSASYPDLDADERTTLTQFLDHYRTRARDLLASLSDDDARTTTLPATALTPGGVVKHLAHIEDHWFTARIAGDDLPEPWRSAPYDRDPDWDFSSAAADSVEEILDTYAHACARSRSVVGVIADLDTRAPRPSFGKGPVTLRWALVHMLEETACHVGHLQMLTDPLTPDPLTSHGAV